ncbi:hypothetical protein UVI_02050630 [Ustilaginoidea virens]|uniref:Uncharacterized protein n=1 Tax=Ustilaginoidea virens TaxID=1159556 RepID=A0A1B5KX68_USTVR|nr:hypothetical protein UVI_02050630 [Ustilaginoidea virens]
MIVELLHEDWRYNPLKDCQVVQQGDREVVGILLELVQARQDEGAEIAQDVPLLAEDLERLPVLRHQHDDGDADLERAGPSESVHLSGAVCTHYEGPVEVDAVDLQLQGLGDAFGAGLDELDVGSEDVQEAEDVSDVSSRGPAVRVEGIHDVSCRGPALRVDGKEEREEGE